MHKITLVLLVSIVSMAHSQVKVGLWEPYYKGNTKKSVFFTGTSLEDYTGNSNEHGTAVGYILTKDNPNLEIYHAGFTPTTQYLTESGILSMTVEERRQNLRSEYECWERFVRQTVAWFKKEKVKLVNMSFGNSAVIFAENNPNLGYTDAERIKVAREWMQHFQKAFDKAFKTAPEILFIVAAGNDELDVEESFDVPAISRESNVLCIGALSKNGSRKISNYGKQVDIYIPSEDIEWIDIEGNKQYNSGTSLAVPQIANKAVLKLAESPKISVAKLKKFLMSKS
ncbi:S8 family serine peptidase [uncultured Flavobacterium sp.]|uniref:S8 family serine peptidase n=1 Tax=uncultured Flavobacterium sp. TaxID=165435 RepID=UPI0025DD77BB|nr:S8 family serine peptidase [uncultured Flavobacterium sp.]